MLACMVDVNTSVVAAGKNMFSSRSRGGRGGKPKWVYTKCKNVALLQYKED